MDPQARDRKDRTEAFLQKHRRVVTPLIIGGAVAIYILPWFFLPLFGVLTIQVFATLILYLWARTSTRAFDHHDRTPPPPPPEDD
ncbi:MAG: hypothetical protein KQJ78_05480 [Deltaproteobacteria bacterium]|nr:hypothetical protein [Deltaproteobacteria bacterium]